MRLGTWDLEVKPRHSSAKEVAMRQVLAQIIRSDAT